MILNQIKIGKFIADCRKEKNITQRQLAEQLEISDKTVSKWETGRGMPEAQFMLPLCEQLGISVNELLSGERLAGNEYQKKAEENIVALVDDQNTKKKLHIKIKPMGAGYDMGMALAMILSYSMNASIGYAILHGILGWIYVIYYAIKY